MKAIVKEIQVGGIWTSWSLVEACRDFVNRHPTRTKMIFVIELPNKEIRQITIRDEDDCTIAYGEFEGLPSMLDYAKEVCDKES